MDDVQIKTTHAGSLPRDEQLVRLLRPQEPGREADAGDFERAAQAAVGLNIIGDGEQTREHFADARRRLTGFGAPVERFIPPDVEPYPELAARLPVQPGGATMAACDGPVAYTGQAWIGREIERLTTILAEQGRTGSGFMSAPSPGTLAFLGNSYYRDYRELLFAVAEAMSVEYRKITGAGLTLQLDAPDLLLPRFLEFFDQPVAAFRKRVELHVEAINHALQGIPPAQVRLHACHGNWMGPRVFDADLGEIIDILYLAHVGTLMVPLANPRHHHEWRVFRSHPLPDGMQLAAGVIDVLSPRVEHACTVADTLTQLAAIVGPGRLLASTECGFATFAGHPAVPAPLAYQKLESLVMGAALATQQVTGALAAT
jgi:5-methyltetrahydropteroyltriglutamate--homocysteine methyltransferase